MLYQEVTRISFESFRELSAGKKVILLYPWANYRNLFLTYFLTEAQEGLVYYRVSEDQKSLISWLKGMAQELDEVLGGFGSNLRGALDSEDPTQMAQALAADLDDFRKDQTVLFVDELDRIPQDANFKTFIREFVAALPQQAQFAVNSRLLTYKPWVEMVANEEAVVLGTIHRRNNLLFSIEEMPKPQLEIYAFGRGHAVVNGRQIENWDGALPRNLFFYFVDNPLVTRDQIFEVFWPKLTVKEATNVFHVTKRKITERISMKVDDPGNYELTKYSAGFYMPSDKVVRHYDVTDFEESLEQSLLVDADEDKERLYRRAIDIYTAPFLQTINMPWVHERRRELQTMYAEALIGMGRIYKRRERFEDSLGFFTRSLKEAPQREDIHREAMTMYMNMGRLEDGREQYRKLEEFLEQTVGIGPSRETRELLTLIESKM